MRVCYITPRPLHRSPAALGYAHALHQLAFPIDLVYQRTMDGTDIPPPNDIHTHIQVESASIHRLSPLASWRFARTVLTRLAQSRYDVIHVEAYRGCSLLPMMGQRISKQWLIDIRTSNVTSFGLKAIIADRLTALESRVYTHTLIHSQELGEHMLGRRPFTVVHPGADLQRFLTGDRDAGRRALNLASSDIVIVYTGALHVERTPLNFLSAFAQVAAKYPKTILLVVGDGEMRPAMQKSSAELGLENRTLFTGRVPFETVQNYVAAGDIGLAYVPVTPNFEHNPPLKTVEFLAAGLPTIATNTGGNRLYVQHGENGLLVDDAPTALAAAIERLIDDPDLAAQLGANARQSVLQYDWYDIVKRQLLPIYQQCSSS